MIGVYFNIMENRKDIEEFYTKLFTENKLWSTPYPNNDEARRLAKIFDFLSKIAEKSEKNTGNGLRILDIGCGRGWLTHQANIYGICEGIDPVVNSIDEARKYFPELTFYRGTVDDLLQTPNFKPYDVVIASEVIEHVLDKNMFVYELSQCIVPKGYAIITTPRGEEFQKWLRLGYEKQPVEIWISERNLYLLFKHYGFKYINHDRVYLDLPGMSFLHQLSSISSRKLKEIGFTPLLKGLQYMTGFYQVWLFQK